MKNLLFVFLIAVVIYGCAKSDYSPYLYSNESTIFSTTTTTQFSALVVVLDPYIMIGGVKKFIVTDTIVNVRIKVNDKLWGVYRSFGIDTSIFVKDKVSNFYSTNITTKYSVIAPYTVKSDTLRTAGEYSDLLNNYLTLEPGNYICQVESFQIRRADGTMKTVKPFIVVPIEVKANTTSSFVGEFEVPINNN